MAQRSLTTLLTEYHDKLNQHTALINELKMSMEALQSEVKELERQVAKEDESSGLRAGLKDWLASFKELL